MQEVIRPVIEYLEGEKEVYESALQAYTSDSPIDSLDSEVKKMREIEAIKLREKITDLNKHIKVIKLMVPKSTTTTVKRSKK